MGSRDGHAGWIGDRLRRRQRPQPVAHPLPGGLPGSRPEEAFFVKCDRSTRTQADLDQGRLICLVGVATARPAESDIFRIGQWTADRPCRA